MNAFFTDDLPVSTINTCVYVRAGVGARVHHNRPYHGLVVQIGSIRKYVFSDGKSMTVPPNSVFYLPKFSNYEVFGIDDGDCIAINFELQDSLITYPFFVCGGSNPHYLRLFEKALHIWDMKQPGYLNQCYKILYEVICNIQNENQQYFPSSKRQLLDAATAYIAQNLSNNDLTIFDVSGNLNITPEYLRRIFKAAYGISPRKYIMTQRINRASELIALKEFKLHEIAKMCGFRDASYFSTEFKKATSYTPSEYLKQH